MKVETLYDIGCLWSEVNQRQGPSATLWWGTRLPCRAPCTGQPPALTFFSCNFESHSSYISVQEGSPGGYEHWAPVQQTSAYWQGCYVCSWTKRRGEQNFCQSNMNENVDRLARPILETYVNSMRMKVCLGWPAPVEDRVQACSFGWRSWSLFQPVHTEERWINRKWIQ